MKTILFTLAIVLMSNLSFSQSKIGYKYNYEIKFDVTQFANKEPRNTVRKFVDHIFEVQNQKFNVQTRYNEKGILFISSNTIIDKCTVETFFHAEKSEILSFELKPTRFESKETKSNVAQN